LDGSKANETRIDLMAEETSTADFDDCIIQGRELLGKGLASQALEHFEVAVLLARRQARADREQLAAQLAGVAELVLRHWDAANNRVCKFVHDGLVPHALIQARALEGKGELREALRVYSDATKTHLSEVIGGLKEIATFEHASASYADERVTLKRAIAIINKTSTSADAKAFHDGLLADCLKSLAKNYHASNQNGDADQAYRQAYHLILNKPTGPLKLVEQLLWLAWSAQSDGCFKVAEPILKTATVIMRNMPQPDANYLQMALLLLGNNYQVLSNFSAADRCYLEAVAADRNLSNKTMLTTLMLKRAEVAEKMGKRQQARLLSQEAKRLIQQLPVADRESILHFRATTAAQLPPASADRR
jgi:tetratricopeptide (TPR) repeat protein